LAGILINTLEQKKALPKQPLGKTLDRLVIADCRPPLRNGDGQSCLGRQGTPVFLAAARNWLSSVAKGKRKDSVIRVLPGFA
jgi:hypothetical protein